MCKLIHMFQGQIGDEINNFSNCSLSRRPGGHEHTTEERTNTHGTPQDKKQFLIHTLNKQPLNKLYPLNKQKTWLFHRHKCLSWLRKSAPRLCELHQNDPKRVLKHSQYINMNLKGNFGPQHFPPQYGRQFKSGEGKFLPNNAYL